jgi:hypothetical protein
MTKLITIPNNKSKLKTNAIMYPIKINNNINQRDGFKITSKLISLTP